MKKLIILLLTFLLSSNLFATAVNEYKSDIYFANGVGATFKEASYLQRKNKYENYIDSNLEI